MPRSALGLVEEQQELSHSDDAIAAFAPWLPIAFSHLGISERAGSATETKISAFYRAVGHPDIIDDETPWCAAFVGACLASAGHGHTGSLAARSYLHYGTALAEDRLGAIAVFRRTSNPSLGHVGFIVGSARQSLYILSGNQSDEVSIAAFPREDLLDRRWPSKPRVNTDAQTTGPTTTAPFPPSGFAVALAHVLKMEGGYTDDPYDPGGPTNLGITLATYANHLGLPSNILTNLVERDDLVRRLRVLTPSDVAPIYHRAYWEPSHAPELSAPLALFHFDASVNHGVRRAAELLQAALGVEVDGDIGPLTLSASRRANPEDVLERYATARRNRYRALPHFWRFGRGWLRRVDQTLAAAKSLTPLTSRRTTPSMREIDQVPSQEPPSQTSPPPTGTQTDPSKWWGHSMTIWGTILTALSTVLPVVGPLLGVELSPELLQKLGAEVTRALQAIGGVLGIVLTILGRARAATPLVRRQMQINL